MSKEENKQNKNRDYEKRSLDPSSVLPPRPKPMPSNQGDKKPPNDNKTETGKAGQVKDSG